jgi:hypothetical protein
LMIMVHRSRGPGVSEMNDRERKGRRPQMYDTVFKTT